MSIFTAPQADFVRRVRALVRDCDSELSKRTVDLVTAFFAHEVGYGSGGAYPLGGHNLGNVTRAPGDNRPVDYREHADYKLGASGEHVSIPQRWAHYESDAEAVREWFALLGRVYPAALAQLRAGDLAFIGSLWRGGQGYFGETVEHYLNGPPYPGYSAVLAAVEDEPDDGQPASVAAKASKAPIILGALAMMGAFATVSFLFLKG